MSAFRQCALVFRRLLPWESIVVLGAAVASAGAMAADQVTIRSHSGAFIVHGLPVGTTFSRSPTSQVEYLRLDPAMTAVSLERIRQTLVSELHLPDKTRGLITVTTHPVEEDYPTVHVAAVHYNDGWGYRVDLPERLEKVRFFSVAVQVILLEFANRAAVLHEAELPPWLAEGLATELMTVSLTTLALEPGAEVAQRERNPDPLRNIRELLRQRPALKFDDLCMPTPEQLVGEEGAFYRVCAYLFVHELLRLRGGRDALRDMLARLPENLNWQTTFLKSFASHFSRLIDVDKWYALNAVNLSGRDRMSLWPADTTLNQLDEILAIPVQVRLQTNQLPLSTTTTLQRIVAEWTPLRQQPVFRQRYALLQALRQRAAAELLELVDDYLRALQAYPVGHENAGSAPRTPAASRVRALLKQLDELDVRRKAMRERVVQTQTQTPGRPRPRPNGEPVPSAPPPAGVTP